MNIEESPAFANETERAPAWRPSHCKAVDEADEKKGGVIAVESVAEVSGLLDRDVLLDTGGAYFDRAFDEGRISEKCRGSERRDDSD